MKKRNEIQATEIKPDNNVTSIVPFPKTKDENAITFEKMVFVFTLCAVIGWVVETIFIYLAYGKWANRGMTYGPYCTIYGVGGLILYLLFHRVKPSKANIPYTFIATALTMGVLELVSGLFLKHVLGIEMWNYDKEFLPILHYTSVPVMIGWGILATVYVFFAQPLLLKIISYVPKTITRRLAIIILLIYAIDLGFSFFNMYANPEILYHLVNPNG